MANQLFLSLGANLGKRRDNLQSAIAALGPILAVETISPVYETVPWGPADQPDFLNACLRGRTLLPAAELIAACKRIERDLGRQPTGPRYGPRPIDIDLLGYGLLATNDADLTLPHPRLAQRAFVLAPLADIAPDWQPAGQGPSVQELLAQVDAGGVRRLDGFKLRRPARFAWRVKTYVMGIVNLTPDSFSGDGLLSRENVQAAAVAQARQFEAAGADILDLGGESTRPGSQPVPAEVELARVLPALEAIRPEVVVPISIDTYRASVAEAALAAGANWINDVWALRMDVRMAAVAAEAGCPVVLMHNRSRPKDVEQEAKLGGRYVGTAYDDLLEDIGRELLEHVETARQAGIRDDHIVLDPGIGFGKSVEQNLRLLDGLGRIKALGFPLLAGPSRKSFIGYSLNLPPEERLEGTAAAVAIAIDRGADVVRVHDVAAMVRVAEMTDRIVRA
ncbi:MAG: dihydropteroate synthase [Candidatus Promineifilaceae bacterium]